MTRQRLPCPLADMLSELNDRLTNHAGHDDGPLRVVPGTHGMGTVKAEDAPSIRERLGEDVCIASPGDASVMRPLLLHASSIC